LKEKTYQYSKNWYDSKRRFCSYWHQINEIIEKRPRNVLEIGVGSGFVSRYLREKQINITTLDIVYSLKPDIVGNVLEIPFAEKSFEIVACCEVLEHLPYSEFHMALGEINRVSQKNVILSLPDVTTIYRIHIELPRMKPITKMIPHPFPRPPDHVFCDEHYWEIGLPHYPVDRIFRDIQESGFKIVNTYRVFEWPWHRFVVLENVE